MQVAQKTEDLTRHARKEIPVDNPAEHRQAIDAIIRILASNDCADAEFTARAILAALVGHGWRPTNAQPPPPPQPPSPPTDDYRAVRDAIAGRTDHG